MAKNHPSRADLVGRRFGKLTVVEFSHIGSYRHAFWKCKCDCGGERVTCSRSLLSGRTIACGCIRRATGKQNKGWKGYGDLSLSYFNKIKIDAKKRSLPFKITIRQCWQLFEKQNGKCRLSGEDLNFQSKVKTPDGTASLDRIDSSKGYVTGNIQWVHKDVNIMKWDLPLERFLELNEKIYKRGYGVNG